MKLIKRINLKNKQYIMGNLVIKDKTFNKVEKDVNNEYKFSDKSLKQKNITINPNIKNNTEYLGFKNKEMFIMFIGTCHT